MSTATAEPSPAKQENSNENGNQPEQQNEDAIVEQHHPHHYGGGGGGGHGQGQGFQGGRRGGGNRFSGGGGFRRQPMNANENERNDFFGGGGGGGRKRGGRGGGNLMQGGERGPRDRNPDDRLNDRVAQMSGPTFDLAPLDTAEKKFSGRARLYIGNIATESTEEEIHDLFKNYGETNELFVNKEKNFGFIKMDFNVNAEKAKRELDGSLFKGRMLKIRFAPNGSSVKVRNLPPFVSNELLYFAFSAFGEIERCIVIVDDRGKPTGEGLVEYVRKGSATLAIRKCSDDCFFLTASLRPVIVELYDAVDEADGCPEKTMPKKNMEYTKAREIGPRFANPNSFEHEYGMRWKQLHELFAQKELALKKELDMEKEKLEAQMEYARYEHETEMLREELRAREMGRDRQKREWEMKERQAEETRQRTEEQMRRQQEEMQTRMLLQEEELRRRQQENNLFMQAHQLDDMLDQQEQAYEQPERGIFNANMNAEQGGNATMDPKQFMNQFDRNHRFEGREMGQRGGNAGGGRGHWVKENRGGGNRDDFPNKRRRF
ncbi:hrp65 protein-like isoform X1 [Photinus pyralis]|uniref:RRM domain-containing protein n=1 Tax=Photinus pyralis TaxID=7054 RepID=A0A1Y1JUM9_PHOPY|nr:hrp65 protein-like isoform X1 [Photinus pyralis]